MQAATPEPLAGRRGAIPWGPKHVLLGILAGILAVVVTNVVFFGLVWGTGAEFQTRDVGDVFEKAGEIATYADDRLAAATTGEELPDPPRITADQTTLVLALATTLALNVLLIAVVAVVTQNDMGSLLRQLGFTRFSVRGLWRPAVAVVGCYAMVATYAAIVTALDIKALEPKSTLPTEVIRQPVTLALTGLAVVVAAPLGEELFYRGLIFGGLQRWGFWPAALLSGAVFSGVHLDLGSLVPFFIIGVTLAWLFWRRGNLWESVAFHVLFNAASFFLLLATEA